MIKLTYYIDMDGVLSNFHKEPYSYKNAIDREWIANLEPFMHNVKVVKQLIKQGYNVYISTKAASEQAKQGKLDWLSKYIPELPQDKIICIVGNGNKAEHMRTAEGILIDDDIKNCRQWAKAGHTYIHLQTKGELIKITNL